MLDVADKTKILIKSRITENSVNCGRPEQNKNQFHTNIQKIKCPNNEIMGNTTIKRVLTFHLSFI